MQESIVYQGRCRKSIFQGQCRNSSKLKPLMFAWLSVLQQSKQRGKKKQGSVFFFYFMQAKTTSFHSKSGQKIKALKQRRFELFRGLTRDLTRGKYIIFQYKMDILSLIHFFLLLMSSHLSQAIRIENLSICCFLFSSFSLTLLLTFIFFFSNKINGWVGRKWF